MHRMWELGLRCHRRMRGELRLVACRSRKLSSAEKNYPEHEKEMLALVDTLEEWRHYLLGVAVLVYTDNSALSYLQKNPKPSPRQVRWLEKLQRYDLKISHIPGRSNVAADALSRYQVDVEVKRGESVLNAIGVVENVCDYGEEKQVGGC